MQKKTTNAQNLETLGRAIWTSLEPCNMGFYVNFESLNMMLEMEENLIQAVNKLNGIYFEPTDTFDEDGNDYGCFELDYRGRLGDSIIIDLTKEQNMEWYERDMEDTYENVPQIFKILAEAILEVS